MYDVIIIGGGPGGYWAAKKAGQAGLKTLLFEKKSLGGVCVSEGCIPSKTYINAAKMYGFARHNKYFSCDSPFDLKKLKQKKKITVARLTKGIELDVKECGAEIIRAVAEVDTIEKDHCKVVADGVEYSGKNLVIATGSEAVVPPIPGLEEGIANSAVLSHRDVFELEQLPERIAVIGGGVIGIELAMLLNNLGVAVALFEQADQLAGSMDDDICGALNELLAKKGIEVYTETTVTQVSEGSITYANKDDTAEWEAEKIVLSAGRRPSCGEIDCRKHGIKLNGAAIETDLQCRTNVPNVYAIGDVNGKMMLAHTAYKEAEVCINTILGKNDQVDYSLIPSVIYSTPEAASVGLTEQQAREQGAVYTAKSLPLSFSGRYLAENELGNDFCKLLLDAGGKIIGFHMLGPYASEIITQMTIALYNKMSLHELRNVVFPHPTVAEIIHELVHKK